MILSDREIIESLDSGEISISPFNEDYLTPNGYDLGIGGVEVDNEMIEPKNNVYIIPPLKDFRVVSVETIRCDAMHVAFLNLKTRYSRHGIQGTFGKIDAGFNGTLTFGLFNGSNYNFKLLKGDRIVQIDFRRMLKPAEQIYEERSGNYQHQKDIVMK